MHMHSAVGEGLVSVGKLVNPTQNAQKPWMVSGSKHSFCSFIALASGQVTLCAIITVWRALMK